MSDPRHSAHDPYARAIPVLKHLAAALATLIVVIGGGSAALRYFAPHPAVTAMPALAAVLPAVPSPGPSDPVAPGPAPAPVAISPAPDTPAPTVAPAPAAVSETRTYTIPAPAPIVIVQQAVPVPPPQPTPAPIVTSAPIATVPDVMPPQYDTQPPMATAIPVPPRHHYRYHNYRPDDSGDNRNPLQQPTDSPQPLISIGFSSGG